MESAQPKTVTLLTRATCGSCDRIRAQIAPVVRVASGKMTEIDVDSDPELAAEFGDRVPVVLIDDEEFACWEVDNDELAAALRS